MTIPKRWTPGDPITAERLNTGLTESVRSRRDISLGQGSSMVNETLGNQSANMRQPLMKLMIAVENFAVPAGRTDLSVGPDDVPSGLCKQMRLSRYDSTHREEFNAFPERVWDVIGGLNDAQLRQCGEVFYAVFNQDSKRWEVLQSSGIRLVQGIVISCLGEGWHEVELTEWDERPDTTATFSESVSASVSDDSPCNVCSNVIQDGVCEGILGVDIDRPTGTPQGETVWAHTTRLLPMMEGGLIKMLKRTVTTSSVCGTSDSTSASGSSSASTSVSDEMITDRLYDVVDGVWPIIALPFPLFECCVDPVTGVETVQMVECNRAIVEGYMCPGEVEPCPVGSESVSVSG